MLSRTRALPSVSFVPGAAGYSAAEGDRRRLAQWWGLRLRRRRWRPSDRWRPLQANRRTAADVASTRQADATPELPPPPALPFARSVGLAPGKVGIRRRPPRASLGAEVVAEDGEVLRELVPVLRLEGAGDVRHELVEAAGEPLLLLGGQDGGNLGLDAGVLRLDQQNQAQHRPAQAPLVGAVLEKDDLEERLQDVGKYGGLVGLRRGGEPNRPS
eukprot:581744-Pyramimonas_sp.AAC.2